MEKLTSKHFVLLVIAATGASILNYPSLFIKLGGRDTWILTLVASIIFFIFSLYILSVIGKTKSYDFRKVCEDALGKTIGNIFIVIYSIVLLLVCVESASVSSNSIRTSIFINTPIWYSLLLFTLTVFWVSKNRFNSILMVTVTSMFVAILVGLLIGILNYKYTDFSILKPIFHDKSISNYVVATITQLGAISSFSIVLPIIERIDDRVKLKKYTIISLLFILIALTWSMINLITALGPYRSSNIFFPQFIQAQRIYFGGFIENGELFVVVTSILFWIVKYILAMFSIYTLWRHKINNKILFIGIASLIVYLLSFTISKNPYTLFGLLYYYQYILIIGLFIFPIIIYTVHNFKFRRKT